MSAWPKQKAVRRDFQQAHGWQQKKTVLKVGQNRGGGHRLSGLTVTLPRHGQRIGLVRGRWWKWNPLKWPDLGIGFQNQGSKKQRDRNEWHAWTLSSGQAEPEWFVQVSTQMKWNKIVHLLVLFMKLHALCSQHSLPAHSRGVVVTVDKNTWRESLMGALRDPALVNYWHKYARWQEETLPCFLEKSYSHSAT